MGVMGWMMGPPRLAVELPFAVALAMAATMTNPTIVARGVFVPVRTSVFLPLSERSRMSRFTIANLGP